MTVSLSAHLTLPLKIQLEFHLSQVSDRLAFLNGTGQIVLEYDNYVT